MKFLALALKLIAALLRLLPCKRQVAFLSRQSSQLSLDYRSLVDELTGMLGADAVVVCVSEPETKGALGFAFNMLRQLKLACTSKVVVVDGYNPVVCIPKKRQGVTVVQAWHSLGAIKKFGYQSLDTPAGRTSQQAEAACMHRNYDVILAAGPGAIPAYSQAFDYPESAIMPLGLPRMDYLLDPSPNSARRQRATRIAQEHPVLANGKRNIVYAPTLRKGEGYENWIDDYVSALAACCPEDKANLIFTGHPLDKDAGADLPQRFACLHILQGVSTIDLLEVADCIITDYSAISLEAGLLEKSTCFFVPDIKAYTASPGLNVDLMDGEAGFASENAHEVMAVALGEDPRSAEAFEAFDAFAKTYFEGVGFGCTQRVASLLAESLGN